MGPIHRIETSIGALALTAIRAAQRRALKVEVREHTDARGRVTPYLLAGTPRRGHLVWLHGFGDRFDTILQAAPRLMDDWQILAPSMPAFGEGWVDPAETHTFDAYADWMFAVLRDVAPPRFHLMGNSLGGATAVKVAARRGLTGRSIRIDLDGGQIAVDWRDDGVWMTGPTMHVFSGVFTNTFLELAK